MSAPSNQPPSTPIRTVIRRATQAYERAMANVEANSAYQAEFKRYKRWVLSQPRLKSDPIMSVENVKMYFFRLSLESLGAW